MKHITTEYCHASGEWLAKSSLTVHAYGKTEAEAIDNLKIKLNDSSNQLLSIFTDMADHWLGVGFLLSATTSTDIAEDVARLRLQGHAIEEMREGTRKYYRIRSNAPTLEK